MVNILNNLYIPFDENRIKQYQSLGYWTGKTHFDFLIQSCHKYANHIAIVDSNYTISYETLLNLSVNFGEYLKTIGIEKDDFVLLQAPNSADFVIALFGIFYTGAKPIFCMHMHNSYEIYHIAKLASAKGYVRVSLPDENNTAEEIIKNMPAALESLRVIKNFQLGEIYTTLTNQNHTINPVSNNSTSIAFLQLSGGTTGIPKLIPRTHDEYLYSVRESAKIAGLDKSSVQLVAIPISHNFAMSSPGILGALYSGAKIVIARDGSPDTCFELIQQHHVTQVSLVPSLVTLWANSTKLKYYNLSSLRVIQVGGSKLSPTLAEKFTKNFPNMKLQQVYGMAEGLVNYTRLDDDTETITNTQGRPISPHDKIVIINENLQPQPKGDIGEIITKGPYTINGYYNAPEINKKSFTPDGFYRTGDLGFIDSKGNIVVTGRCKEIINRAGEKIIPSELETLLLKHIKIKDVSVVGIPDELLGERIHANIILQQSEKSITLQEVREFLSSQNIDVQKMPDSITIVDAFQYTLVGKIKK